MVSGVAAVSAFEGHAVNVRAHVENAMWVEKTEIDFGVVFPEQQIQDDVWIGLSQSFLDQERYSSVQYEVWWEPKDINDPDPQNPALDPDDDGFYEPIYPFILLTCSGDTGMPTQARIDAMASENVTPAGAGLLSKPDDLIDNWHIVFSPPAFDCAVNSITDPTTPSGILILADLDYEMVDEEFDVGETDNITVGVPHADLGNNLKFQVIDVIGE